MVALCFASAPGQAYGTPRLCVMSDLEDVSLTGHLWGAVLARIPAAEHQLSLLRSILFNAEQAAMREGRPYRDLRLLGDEIDTLKEMLHKKVEVVVQRLALEEAGSSG